MHVNLQGALRSSSGKGCIALQHLRDSHVLNAIWEMQENF